MKKILFGLVLFTCSFAAISQQDYQFNQFFNDKVSLNPGATGLNDNCLGVFYRQQWVGFSGNPTTYLLNYHQPVKKLKGGLGITAYNDRLGTQLTQNPSTGDVSDADGSAITTNAVRLNYSFHLPLGPGRLGLGLGFGYQGTKAGSDWYAIDGVANDEAIPNVRDDNAGSLDLNFGAFYKTPKFWAGLSSTHLTAQDLEGTSFDYTVSRHYYFMTGYEAELNSSWKLLPALMVKSDAVSTSIDANVRGVWNDFVWAGVSLRTGIDAISPMAGLNYKLPGSQTLEHSIQFGYSYDVTLSDVKNFSSGSHELFLGYCFKPIQLVIRKKHYNPRFL